ncbi:PREDICTED: short/branched chain specific acyl-CoA dehydrogenase, mitochondrial-like isoform X2 [Amphimedon queenslandica]|nr:PREDICTED: short/branched chain specific acyl-CoA dehydrogenase, mitochondrial-like isoform X2 [Amphimedon queenslandica]XP_019860985.1 PREDICTED: short/branched chain specific acyl-CoA dehydrogenase, mitochondrial-like isoform X2 [Amphimedon queenslandica]|eukprot:XP_011409555.2 PREDICTED: short/branched chain specific acyl-CoA dehydrogenase, mitochondrial-like isoform X2 [Amphimedon queenslandica]
MGLCRRSSSLLLARSYSQPLTVLSEEEQMMKDTVARFANERVKPLVQEMDRESEMSKDIIRGMFEQGFMSIEIGTQHGGTGSTFFSSILAIEELAKVDPSVSVVCDVQNTLVNAYFNDYAGQELKEKYLPRLSTDLLGSFCLSESSSGSDAFAMKCSAKDNGDHWVLNGEKLWITNAEHAGVFIVHANCDFSKKHRGISAFVVDKGTPGLSLGKKEDKLGIRASSTCPVILENVCIPKSQLLGEYGKGYKYAIEVLNTGRIGIGAQMLGLAEGALNATIPYLMERKQFGTEIGSFQAMRHLKAQLATEIEACRLLVYNAARMRDNGVPFVKEAAMAKYYSSEVACKVAGRCVEMTGGVGFVKDYPLEKFYRDSKIGQIYEGTSFIQLNTISDCIDKEYSS